MAPPDFHLQAHVDHLYQQPRKLAFQAQSPAEFERWQRDLRGKVAELLSITGRKLPATVEARSITRTDQGSYTEEKLAIDTGEGAQTPLYVLVPKAEPPYKADSLDPHTCRIHTPCRIIALRSMALVLA